MRMITSDGIQLAYTDQGDGPVILLLAGYSGIKEEWQYQVTFLLQQGYRVITLDWRSHGASTRTAKHLRIMRLAADVQELLSVCQVTTATLVGHSMGASVIWAYLTIFGEQRVSRIVTIDESPKPLNDTYWQAGLNGLTWENFWVRLPYILRQPMTVAGISEPLRQELKTTRAVHPFDEALCGPLLGDHLQQDWRETCQSLTIPQLMIVGVVSTMWQGDYTIICENNNNTAVRIQNAGHMPHMEQPDAVNAYLHTFISA